MTTNCEKICDDLLIILVPSGGQSNYYIGHTFIYQMIHFAFFSLNLTRIQFKWSVWVYTVPSFTCPDIVHNQITFRWKDLLLLLFWWCWDALGRHNNTDLELKASISFPSTHNYFAYFYTYICFVLGLLDRWHFKNGFSSGTSMNY